MDLHLVHMMLQRQYIWKEPTCFSLGDLDGFKLGTYDNTNLVSLEGSSEGIAEVNFEGLLLSA